jgi:lipopolysaccharide transport system ATP-binding protein
MTDTAIRVENLGKCYQIYNKPNDRLKQSIYPRLQGLVGKQPSQYYREFWALRDVSFEVKKGETIGIIGRNGCGKSTLLQLICGTLAPSYGSVTTKGRVAALLELGAGFNPEFTGRENVYMNGAILGMTIDDINRRFEDIAAFADIGDFIEQPVKTYSSGMYVRLAFAVAVNVDPDILIIDEALAVGDMLFQRKCFSKLEQFVMAQKTILFVTHGMATVNQFCSSAILLDAGELLLAGAAKLVTTQYERYLFSNPAQSAAIREEIKKNEFPDFNIICADHGYEEIEAKETIDTSDTSSDCHKSSELKPRYYDNLLPDSTIEYRNYDVQIDDISIKTLKGDKVNVLIMNEPYIYSYKVTFNISAEDVSFGMVFKATSGLILNAAASFEILDNIITVKKGEAFHISWKFVCTFLPNMYFTDVGVSAIVNDCRIYLNRVVDATVFKVEADSPEGYYGLVTLNQMPLIERV